MKTTTYNEAFKSLFMNKPALRKPKTTTIKLSFLSILIVFLVSIVSPNLSAQIQLTADIFPGNTSSVVSEFAVYNNKLYFSADDGTVGRELYVYDGTNVSLVADINLGTANSTPSDLTVFNNKLYFSAIDGSVGRELWVYDGTTVSLAADINPGTTSSSPTDLTVYNNKLYFRAFTGFQGVELWVYDGTTASIVNDIHPSGSSSPSFLTVYNNKLFFSANNGVTGFELWVYDGATTALAQDIRTGPSGSFPAHLTVYNNKLYFQANNGSSGNELLVYDGTTTSLAVDINPGTGGSFPIFLTVFNNKLFFRASDGNSGSELWEYDGTTVSLAADINQGTNSSSPTDLTVFNNKLYFSADDGIAGQELWVYDGLTTSLVDDYLPGIGGSSPTALIVYGNTLYFQASDFDGTNGPNIHGAELCEYSPCSTTFGTDIQAACNTFTWIDNNTYTASNNTATFNIANGAANGCDSLVTLDLTIINSATGTDVQTACNTFTWIDNNTYTANNNTATFNIANGAANGCDSLVTLDLTIINSSTGTDVQTACNTFTWIDNNTYTASNNTATFNIANGAANGCDSLVTLDLTIINSSTGTDIQTACNTFTWIDNNTYTASNNTATFNIANGAANGCDSLVTLDLTIINSATGTDVQTACNTFTWIDNNTYTASNNTATFNIVGGAANGCDSVVTLNLTITTVDNTTILNTNTISANQNGATYRWLDCNNGNAVISGETAQSFTPTATGNYAVEITLGSCIDTSACTNVIITNIDESIMESINIFPNPTKDDIYVELPLNEFSSVEVKIYSVTGKLVYNTSQNNVSKLSISTANWDKGIYFIQLISNNQTITEKIIKQ